MGGGEVGDSGVAARRDSSGDAESEERVEESGGDAESGDPGWRLGTGEGGVGWGGRVRAWEVVLQG